VKKIASDYDQVTTKKNPADCAAKAMSHDGVEMLF